MHRSFVQLVAAALALLLAAASLPAQQRPTAQEAQALLQSNPDLVSQLRAKLLTSGLTPDQIRARLRAEGYPANLLDAYLPGGAGTADTIPGSVALDAVSALGVLDSATIDSLRLAQEGTGAADSARMHALLAREVICDSVTTIIPSDSVLADTVGGGLVPDSVRAAVMSRPHTRTTLVCRPLRRFAVSPVDSGYTIFGLDMFSQHTTQFQPNLSGPVDPSYRLGPGDRLVLILTGDVESAHVLDVTREGFVVIPQVGQLYVANLTLAQLDDLLYARLGRVYSGVRRGPRATTHFSVNVARLRTNQVFVIGDVAHPGSYQVSSAGTALTALYAAGGPTRDGSLRRVEIRRGGTAVDTLDVYDYLLRGDASHDPRLQSGDIVFVPVHGPRVRVVGEVVRPATYELKPGETLGDVIHDAGGYTAGALTTRVQIERILPPAEREPGGRDRVVIDVTASQPAGAGGGARGGSGTTGAAGNAAPADGVLDAAALAMPVVAGDVVRVFPITRHVSNRIRVLGDVWTPGQQGYERGMHLSDAIRVAGGIRPDAYLGQVLVTRLEPDSSRVELRASFRDSTGALVNDIPLRHDDEVRVFSVAEFRAKRYVSITGAVNKSGRVPYRDGMTLRDLVLLAGGLRESAFLGHAEIARLPESRAGGTTAVTVQVPLDSSYLFERSPDGRYLGPPGLPAPRGPEPEVPLKPYDNVLVLRQPNWSLQRTVVVDGEVRFPGRYALLNMHERLGDVIQRAGGFTSTAYPGGVAFYRTQGHLGRIGVDLPRVMQDSSYRDNLVLENGDSIFIPPYSGVVDVQGAVNSPVAVAYVPGENLDYYVDAAGGPSLKADMKRAYVTQPNGKVESVHRRFFPIPSSVPDPRPGSVVYVPQKGPSQGSTWATTLPILASVLGSLATVWVVVKR